MFTLTSNMFLGRDDEGTPINQFTFVREDSSPVPFDEIEDIAEAFYGTPDAAILSFEEHLWFTRRIMMSRIDR